MIKDRFGKWTVIGPPEYRGTNSYVLCQCDCGTKRIIPKGNISSGKSTSCGCGVKRPLDGKRFGFLVVLCEKDKKLLCRCDCGKEKLMNRSNLTQGNAKSCGCMKTKMQSQKVTTHGLSKSSEYGIWRGMLTRCYSKNHPSYKNHGSRGIIICDRWKRFENFHFDMGNRPTDRHCIERVDNDGNYDPSNCVWATYKRQQNNRRSNVHLTYNGLTMTISEWTDWLGMSHGLIESRLHLGWSVEKTLTTPKRETKKRV